MAEAQRLTISANMPPEWASLKHPVGEAIQALFSALNDAAWHLNLEEEAAGRPRLYAQWEEVWNDIEERN